MRKICKSLEVIGSFSNSKKQLVLFHKHILNEHGESESRLLPGYIQQIGQARSSTQKFVVHFKQLHMSSEKT